MSLPIAELEIVSIKLIFSIPPYHPEVEFLVLVRSVLFEVTTKCRPQF